MMSLKRSMMSSVFRRTFLSLGFMALGLVAAPLGAAKDMQCENLQSCEAELSAFLENYTPTPPPPKTAPSSIITTWRIGFQSFPMRVGIRCLLA